MLHVVNLVTDCARAHAFQQGRHTGGVAQSSTVVHVIASKANTHQLLEQVGFLVTTLGRAKPCQRLVAIGIAQAAKATRRQGQSLFPRGFSENRRPVGRVAVQVVQCLRVFGYTGLADQWHRQTLRAVGIVKSKPALDTQTAVVSRAIASVHANDQVVLDVVSEQATDTTKRTNGVHFFVDNLGAQLCFWHQRPRGAGLHAFAARHAGAVTHGVVQIEHDLAVAAAHGIANNVVDLLFAARTHAAVALDAGIQVDGHSRMRHIGLGLFASQGLEFWAHLHVQTRSPGTQFTVLLRLVIFVPLVPGVWHVRKEHLQHHLLAF